MSEFPYEDIINLPRPVSKKRRPMPVINRAAQFAPFAALTGYDDAIEETARQTGRKTELEDYEKEEIGRRLYELKEKIKEKPQVNITYFVPDELKDGGEYVTFSGAIKKIDEINQLIVTEDNCEILMDCILFVEETG